MADPVFFTSYARIDDEKEELRAVIGELEYAVKSELGQHIEIFFDKDDVENGQDWEQRLGEALRKLRVMVSMCSPAFVKSKFCAKEYAVFRQRLRDANSNAGVAILPVIWVPVALPKTLGAIHQPKDARLPADYARTGLRKYWSLTAQRDNFNIVINALAQDIKQAYIDSPLGEWPNDVHFSDLPDSFDNPRPVPYSMRLTVLDDLGSRWQPGYDATIGTIFDRVAEARDVPWQDVAANELRLVEQLREAEQQRIGVIYVIDSAAAGQPPWQGILADLDDSGCTNFAVLIAKPKNAMPTEVDKPAALQTYLPRTSAPGTLHDFIPRYDEKACEPVLTRTMAALRRRLVKEDEAAPVQADQLRQQALDEGIEVDRIATLPGPGVQQ